MTLNERIDNHREIKKVFCLKGNPKKLRIRVGEKRLIFIHLLKIDVINKNVIFIMSGLTDLIVDCDDRYIYCLKNVRVSRNFYKYIIN